LKLVWLLLYFGEDNTFIARQSVINELSSAAIATPSRGLISVRNPKAHEKEPPNEYFFDAVFDEKVEQKHIFNVCASGDTVLLIAGRICGLNVLCFRSCGKCVEGLQRNYLRLWTGWSSLPVLHSLIQHFHFCLLIQTGSGKVHRS
jgi:hypothetical protein